jgi:YbgC/YbaW family acyl-CoA thioester hydrolase
MAFRYEWELPVRGYEVGYDGTVIPYIYVQYLEESATQASAAYGYTLDWYRSRSEFWVVRRLQLRYHEPARVDDRLHVATWISDIKRVSSSREYDVRRAGDGAQVLRGRHDWVYVDAEKLAPRRIPADFSRDFTPDDVIPDLDVGIPDSTPVTNPAVFTLHQYARADEIDLLKIVNNAIYARWGDHAVTEALRAMGISPLEPLPGGVTMHRIGRELEYLRGSTDNIPITIRTYLSETGADRARWMNEILHGETGDLIARDRLTFAFRDETGAACPLPKVLRVALVAPQEEAEHG